MKTTPFLLFLALTLLSSEVLSQKGPPRFFGEPILTDSLSTFFIPTRYNAEFLSSNKITIWGDYYANIVAYNFKTDTYKKVFEKDTYIESLQSISYSYPRTNTRIRNLTSGGVFLLVKNKDTNNSGRIDERDPSILFVLSLDGQNLKQMTNETENVVSFDVFEKQGFVLLRIQRDSDNDKSFKAEDKEFYFRKVNLSDLTLGRPIEVN